MAARARRSGKDETIWWKVTIWGEQFDKIIPYFKKGSAIIVVGELSKPEIFTDREGRPQVSMNITASNIMFNPFGRPDGQNTAEGITGTPIQQSSHPEMAHAAPQSQDTPFQGQGRPDPAFSEDEIPF